VTGSGPVTASVARKRATAAPIALAASRGTRGGGYGIRTRVHGFAGRCLASRPTHRGCSRIIRNSAPDESSGAPLPRSGRPDSNRRPSPWQGDALPTELRPHDGIRRSSRGRYWDRTSDLFRVKEARYPCANRPEMVSALLDRTWNSLHAPSGCSRHFWV